MAIVTAIKGVSYAPFTSTTVASGAYALDAVGFNNTSAGMTSLDLQLYLSSAVTPSSGGTISIYLVAKVDGTNYPSPGNSVAAPPSNYLVGTYACLNTSTQYIDIYDMPMTLPYQCQLILYNNSGVSITITSSVAQPKTIQIA
jgi:hypothetical protein